MIYTVPKKGSLGLLALGYAGVQMWRRKILEVSDSERRLVGPIILGKEISVKNPKVNEKK